MQWFFGIELGKNKTLYWLEMAAFAKFCWAQGKKNQVLDVVGTFCYVICNLGQQWMFWGGRKRKIVLSVNRE